MAASSSRLLLLVSVVVLAAAAAYPAAAGKGRRYQVGGTGGWVVPPPEEKEAYYVRWASSVAVYVDDSIEFVYRNDSAIKVTKAGYYHCNETAGIDSGDVPAPADGVRVFHLYAPGLAYFASADLDHCNKGQRLMVNVLAADQPPAPPAQGPSSAVAPPLSPSPEPSTDYSGADGAAGSAFAAAAMMAPIIMAALV
ncbi:cucumber peeling cupredoxin-like [Oryza brachyantha]|uniref:cucumber peeling cupredoxin-like n=1 Tax=Oryza brachyantha TaxID=4533 RepID=UPI001ADB9A27|nr:cucumber peeling cupredoxin-like [Oryza brachyantha]